jgi:hypothetical protein
MTRWVFHVKHYGIGLEIGFVLPDWPWATWQCRGLGLP